MVRGAAAEGLKFAAKPTHTEAASKLTKTLIDEISGTDQRASDRGNAVGDRVDLSLVMKIADALGIIGEPAQLEALRKLINHKNVSPAARPLLETAISQIESRVPEAAPSVGGPSELGP